ncbi:neurofilament triplet h protein [Anaeramoeba flamelloides]|uniref:Neurofilament triplet h protein n=1 Tax=Anaeramoeba flamelloides TaxID=1746091 RepID=A0AAV7ZI12_9EUKA|nr:neurofilament triplet h protein [Anaeramoeba flamelloides]
MTLEQKFAILWENGEEEKLINFCNRILLNKKYHKSYYSYVSRLYLSCIYYQRGKYSKSLKTLETTQFQSLLDIKDLKQLLILKNLHLCSHLKKGMLYSEKILSKISNLLEDLSTLFEQINTLQSLSTKYLFDTTLRLNVSLAFLISQRYKESLKILTGFNFLINKRNKYQNQNQNQNLANSRKRSRPKTFEIRNEETNYYSLGEGEEKIEKILRFFNTNSKDRYDQTQTTGTNINELNDNLKNQKKEKQKEKEQEQEQEKEKAKQNDRKNLKQEKTKETKNKKKETEFEINSINLLKREWIKILETKNAARYLRIYKNYIKYIELIEKNCNQELCNKIKQIILKSFLIISLDLYSQNKIELSLCFLGYIFSKPKIFNSNISLIPLLWILSCLALHINKPTIAYFSSKKAVELSRGYFMSSNSNSNPTHNPILIRSIYIFAYIISIFFKNKQKNLNFAKHLFQECCNSQNLLSSEAYNMIGFLSAFQEDYLTAAKNFRCSIQLSSDQQRRTQIPLFNATVISRKIEKSKSHRIQLTLLSLLGNEINNNNEEEHEKEQNIVIFGYNKRKRNQNQNQKQNQNQNQNRNEKNKKKDNLRIIKKEKNIKKEMRRETEREKEIEIENDKEIKKKKEKQLNNGKVKNQEKKEKENENENLIEIESQEIEMDIEDDSSDDHYHYEIIEEQKQNKKKNSQSIQSNKQQFQQERSLTPLVIVYFLPFGYRVLPIAKEDRGSWRPRNAPLRLLCSSAQVKYKIAKAYFVQKQWDDAFRIYKDLVSQNQLTDKLSLKISEERKIEWIYLCLQQKKFKKVCIESKNLLIQSNFHQGNNDLNSNQSHTRIRIVLLYQADALVMLGKPKQALECLNKLTNTFKINQKYQHLKSIAYNNRAIILSEIGKINEAIQILQFAIRIIDKPDTLIINLVNLLLEQGKIEFACKTWLDFRKIPLEQNLQFYQELLKKMNKKIRQERNKKQKNIIITSNIHQNYFESFDILILTFLVELLKKKKKKKKTKTLFI